MSALRAAQLRCRLRRLRCHATSSVWTDGLRHTPVPASMQHIISREVPVICTYVITSISTHTRQCHHNSRGGRHDAGTLVVFAFCVVGAASQQITIMSPLRTEYKLPRSE